jgi:carbon monoxide dehydrogenase subunit G
MQAYAEPGGAMAVFTIEKTIEAPVATVFARASDVRGWADCISGIERVEVLTDGPIGVGTRFRETRIMFKKEATEEMEITAFEPPRRYALAGESCGCRYQTEITCEPAGASKTRVRMTFESTPLTFAAKVLSVLMRPMMKMMVKTCGRDLDDLKAAIEGSSTSAPAKHAPVG